MKHEREFVLFPQPVYAIEGLVWIKELQTDRFEEHMQANCMSSVYVRFGSWRVVANQIARILPRDQNGPMRLKHVIS